MILLGLAHSACLLNKQLILHGLGSNLNGGILRGEILPHLVAISSCGQIFPNSSGWILG